MYWTTEHEWDEFCMLAVLAGFTSFKRHTSTENQVYQFSPLLLTAFFFPQRDHFVYKVVTFPGVK